MRFGIGHFAQISFMIYYIMKYNYYNFRRKNNSIDHYFIKKVALLHNFIGIYAKIYKLTSYPPIYG